MLCGFGLYILAAGCAVLCFVILRLLKGLERAPGVLWGQIASQRQRIAAPSVATRSAPAPRGGAVTAVSPVTEAAEADAQPEGQQEPESEDVGGAPAEPQPARAARATGKRKSKKRSRRAQRARGDDEISDEWQEVPAVAGRTAA
jgi:hypothetical protein